MKPKSINLIKFRNIRATVQALHGSTSRSLDPIVISNKRVIPYFEETVRFLCGLGLYNEEKMRFTLAGEYLFDEERLKIVLIEKILKKGNPYFEFFLDYISRFDEADGGMLCLDKHSPANQWGSGLRDLLLELGFLLVGENQFEISISYKQVVQSRLRGKVISPTALSRKQAQNKKIGDAAEDLVLSLERKRLGRFPHLLPMVERISLVNAGAGYDIRSFAIPAEHGDPYEINIEVKAVSPIDWKFYWSKPEIKKAHKKRTAYLLYLVPIYDGRPSEQNIRVISNPVEDVLNQEAWLREVESTSFWQRAINVV